MEGGVVRDFGSGSVALPVIAEILPPGDFFFAAVFLQQVLLEVVRGLRTLLDEVVI